MLNVQRSQQFKKDYKKAVKRGFPIDELKAVVTILMEEKELPTKFRDHALNDSRDYKNKRECHIRADWLLVYEIKKDLLILELVRTGTHSDLYR